MKWAASWQNQQCGYAPSEDSDQPGHPPSLIRVFAVRSIGSQGSKLSSCGQRRLWSDWADAQAYLSLRWAHTHFVRFVTRRLTWVLPWRCGDNYGWTKLQKLITDKEDFWYVIVPVWCQIVKIKCLGIGFLKICCCLDTQWQKLRQLFKLKFTTLFKIMSKTSSILTF